MTQKETEPSFSSLTEPPVAPTVSDSKTNNQRNQTTIPKIKRTDLIRSCLMDLAHGKPSSTQGLIWYLTHDLELPTTRVISIAQRIFFLDSKTTTEILSLR